MNKEHKDSDDSIRFGINDKFPVLKATPIVETAQGIHELSLEQDGGSYRYSSPEFRIVVDVAEKDNYLAIDLALAGETDCQIERLYCQIDDGLVKKNSRFFAYPSFFAKDDGVYEIVQDKSYSSNLMSMILNDESAILFAVADMPPDFSFFELSNGVFKFGFDIKRPVNGSVSYKLLINTDSDPMKLLEFYGDYLGDFAPGDISPIQGWNSWDYYAQSVTMQDVCDEMDAINASGLKDSVKSIVIDYGWETSLGDFRPNGKFPQQLGEVASMIKSKGFIPGIWTAPLVAHVFSPIARHQQHLLTRKRDGSPVLKHNNVALDFSHPEVQALLFDLYKSLYDAGFRVFKVDYIYQETIDEIEQWHDMTIGKADLIRIVFDIVRKAVGEECHVINCGAPVETCLGMTNSSRTSIDIHNFWGHIKNNAKQTSLRLWQNQKLWAVDPDFAIVRCSETSDDPYLNHPYVSRNYKDGDWHWFAGEECSLEEMKVLLSFTYLTAGNTVLSDSIARLNDLGVEYLQKIFPVLDQSALPVDLFNNPVARFWVAQKDGKMLIGLFNFDEVDKAIYVPDNYAYIYDMTWIDFWEQCPVGLENGMMQKARSVLLLQEQPPGAIHE